jgi:serine/threonine-protein kinase
MIGTTVAHYRIEEKLGEGGMGEVFRAHDTKLSRDVALKFLPPHLQMDDMALKRFVREARSAAALDHPFICSIYEVGQTEDGRDFISMEYVRGQTLQEKLKSGALPRKQAIQIGLELAEALEAAHSQGIVHRDLKPANIMLTPQGHPKVMDFGLAKRLTGQGDLEQEITSVLTQTGSTIGTIPYMSPEQINGELVDHRSDIFSYGIVFYEMLTGLHPFKKNSMQATIAAIIHEEMPPLRMYMGEVPPLLDHVIRKTLAKDKERRFQLIHEIKTDLADLLDQSVEISSQSAREHTASISKPKNRVLLPWIVAAALALTVISILIMWKQGQEPFEFQSPPAHYSINLEPDQVLNFSPYMGTALAISPDGTKLAYPVSENNTTRIYLRRMDQFEAQPLLGTEGGSIPFFSPDGKWIAFHSGDSLFKLSLEGGTPQTITRVSSSHSVGGSWAPADKIVYSECYIGLKIVSSAGGTPKLITKQELESLDHLVRDSRHPQILPGGKSVLACVDNSPMDKRVAIHSLETGAMNTILRRGTSARYVPSGHIVYAWDGDLLAVPFDIDNLEVIGSPVTVLQGIHMEDLHGSANFAISDTGTLVYVPGPMIRSQAGVALVDRNGDIENLPIPMGIFTSPRISKDGRHILLAQSGELGLHQFLVYDVERGASVSLNDGNEHEYWGIWDSTGENVIYNSSVNGKLPALLFRKNRELESIDPLTPQREFTQQPICVSSDGKYLFFQESETPTGFDIWLMDLSSGFQTQKLLGSSANELHPSISPDSQWLAYASDETGLWEVYVKPFPESARKIRISMNGGWEPIWSSDGKKIYFRSLNGTSIFEVQFDSDKAEAGNPEILIEGPFKEGLYYGPMYDLAPDGRFLVLTKTAQEFQPTEIRVIQNWLEELKRLVPVN